MSEANISQVIINRIWSGMPGREVYTYTIVKIDPTLSVENAVDIEGAEFLANVRVEKTKWQGEHTRSIDEYQEIIESNKLTNLNKSLINLQESLAMRSCSSHTDDYPEIKIAITYDDGQKVVLYSNSNCNLYNPWNVIAENKLYVQYSGEIPSAYLDLMGVDYRDNSRNYFDYDYQYEFPLSKIPEEITGFGRVLHYTKCIRELVLF